MTIVPACHMLTGLTSGFKALLLASLPSEVQAVRQAVDLPGLRGFDDELRRAARRRRTAGAGTRTQPPKGEPAAASVCGDITR